MLPNQIDPNESVVELEKLVQIALSSHGVLSVAFGQGKWEVTIAADGENLSHQDVELQVALKRLAAHFVHRSTAQQMPFESSNQDLLECVGLLWSCQELAVGSVLLKFDFERSDRRVTGVLCAADDLHRADVETVREWNDLIRGALKHLDSEDSFASSELVESLGNQLATASHRILDRLAK